MLGASKHIGYHILEYIASETDKYTLFVLARTPAAKIESFQGKENVTFIQGDARDESTVSKIFNETMQGNVDFVIVTVGILVFHVHIVNLNRCRNLF